eukprot:TRINITY_DN45071_c0_g1_i1.p1 TRINITY_DN45071_c0_g1~~TRINITY_DN45071_c0_g1_i1.p1  ORF type:complete len:248 (+),score=98.32 TRINITY_DN45071_c0_g1_i1:176-919(+)
MASRQKKIEYVGLSGLRMDGRRPGDPRELEVALGCFKDGADGSAAVMCGATRVAAAVYGPKEVAGVRDELCSVTTKCTFSELSSASGHRRRNEQNAQEMSDTVRSVLDGLILRHLYPQSTIHVHLEVHLDDGSALPALLNACTIALAAAGVPVKDLMTACSASLIDSHVLLDVTEKESKAAGPAVTVAVLPASGDILLLLMDQQAEPEEVKRILGETTKGTTKLHAQIKKCLVDHTKQLLKTRPQEK